MPRIVDPLSITLPADASSATMARTEVTRRLAPRLTSGALEEWHASAFEHALEQFDAAARRLKLTENQIAMTKMPQNQIHRPAAVIM